ncbi:sporulation-control protein spo0M [Melghirimyces profundicolus]|uniref:Sporulation-control protein spo0M n=1 Tax=Melghirimyces profundicolus TaxID=1242148 RepID=A0A2T6BXA8_9BACL|nr:sporulation protein [Melghirimyces profundicolus]PTX60714.1 sporulation-control protein spo0M [Melghirimyces profundicolus]
MFTKALASLGVGSAKVDTRLEKTQYQPGDLVRGEVMIRGGGARQVVDDIYLYLIIHYLKNDRKVPFVMEKFHLSESFEIQEKGYQIIPFQFRLPYQTPMSCGRFPIYLKTGLDIKMAKDPTDLDRIEVFPHATVEKVLGEIEQSGFLMYRLFNEHVPQSKTLPFIQIFQFRPAERYHGYLDEMNLFFDVSAHEVHMDVEISRGTRTLNTSFSWQLNDPDGSLTNDHSGRHEPVASPGIGNAKVDTRLKQAQYRQGEMVEGEVFIQGGQVEQKIDEIYLYLVILYHRENSQHEYVMEEHRLSEVFTIGPRETKVIPFEFQLPHDTPVTTGGCPVFLKTGLDIQMAVDPDDTDGIEVLPHPLVEKVLQVVERIGFQLVDIDFEFENFYSRHPFIQEFEFKPTGDLRGSLDELDLMFYVGEERLEAIFQVDRRATDLMTSLEEALELDRKTFRVSVTAEEVKGGDQELERKLADLIYQHSH